jgi:hypothetical protein
MELIGYEISEILTRQIIYLIVIFFVGVVLLHIATKILHFNKSSFNKAAGVLIAGSAVAIYFFIFYVSFFE